MTRKLVYTVRFTTPAFLGDADQSGRWRTPPFKAQLRQWWRVAVARSHEYDYRPMREREARLFGHAWLESDRDAEGRRVSARRSTVRLRLGRWDRGTLQPWNALPPVSHPEVRVPVGSDLYLGYGPLTLPRGARRPELKGGAAIQAGESATLSIAVPEAELPAVQHSLRLMALFGTLGGRSRNGWGSLALQLEGKNGTLSESIEGAVRPWREALSLDWPHSIGLDDSARPLIWQTAQPSNDWKAVMRDLAKLRIALRSQFPFTSGREASYPEPRHWLSYPVTHHSVRGWGSQRLPNTLRFKVRETSAAKRVGVIFHVPCLPPRQFRPDKAAIVETWRMVHALLDELIRPPAQRSYDMITDRQRRAELKPGLDDITLVRSPE